MLEEFTEFFHDYVEQFFFNSAYYSCDWSFDWNLEWLHSFFMNKMNILILSSVLQNYTRVNVPYLFVFATYILSY